MTPLQNAVKTAEGVIVNKLLSFHPVLNSAQVVKGFGNLTRKNFAQAIPIRPINGPAAAAILPPTSKAQATAAAKVNPLKASKRAAKAVNFAMFCSLAAYPRKGCLLLNNFIVYFLDTVIRYPFQQILPNSLYGHGTSLSRLFPTAFETLGNKGCKSS